MDRFLAARAVDGQRRNVTAGSGRRDNLFEPVSGGHRTDGAFGHEAQADPMLLSARAARSGAFFGACALAAATGLALGLKLAGAGRRSGRAH